MRVERRAELLIKDAGGERAFRLSTGSTFLGRGEEAQIRLPEDILEPKHVEFDWDGTELWLIYLGNGIRPLVNGELAAERQLHSGDAIEIGEASLRVRILRRNVAGREVDPVPVVAETASKPVPEPDAVPAPPLEIPPEERIRAQYTVHQLRQQRRRGTMMVAGLVVFFTLMWFFIIPGNTAMLAISVFVILGSVSAFLFPVHYKLTDAGVEIRGVLIRDNKKWTRFERYIVYPDAVQLLVPQRSLRGRVVKGTLVYFHDNKDQVMSVIREKLGEMPAKSKTPAPRS
jgi:pSer/pThr/pTyr-binding forkhead associated (FHA) protein